MLEGETFFCRSADDPDNILFCDVTYTTDVVVGAGAFRPAGRAPLDTVFDLDGRSRGDGPTYEVFSVEQMPDGLLHGCADGDECRIALEFIQSRAGEQQTASLGA